MTAQLLLSVERAAGIAIICQNHYSHSFPSGKTYLFAFGPALVAFSIPANKNLAKFIGLGTTWELSRLWAPDGHEPNLLTRAISAAVHELLKLEPVDVLVSYADPNVGHQGYVYRAASWIPHGQAEESRYYVKDGQVVARRAFHSGGRHLNKPEILALGYEECRRPGKLRYIHPVSKRARRLLKGR